MGGLLGLTFGVSLNWTAVFFGTSTLASFFRPQRLLLGFLLIQQYPIIKYLTKQSYTDAKIMYKLNIGSKQSFFCKNVLKKKRRAATAYILHMTWALLTQTDPEPELNKIIRVNLKYPVDGVFGVLSLCLQSPANTLMLNRVSSDL